MQIKRFVGLVLSLTVSPLHAQTSPDSEADKQSPATLPEVRIEADKDREDDARSYQSRSSSVTPFGSQELQDIPHSVSAFSRNLMDEQLANTLTDVTRNDAAVTSANNAPGYYESVSIRGFSLDNWRNYKRDGLPFVNQATAPLENKERLEILKGLSGIYYGLASPSGIVNYVIKRPKAVPSYHLLATADQYGGQRFHLDASEPLVAQGKQGVRLNLAHQNLQSYVKGSEGQRNFASLAYEVELLPSTRLFFDVDFDESKVSEGASSYGLLGGRVVPKVPDPRETLSQPWSYYKTRVWNAAATLEQTLSSSWKLEFKVLRNSLFRDDASSGPDTSSFKDDGTYDFYEYRSLDETRDMLSGQLALRGTVATGSIVHDLSLGYAYSDFKARWGDGVYELLGTGNMFETRPEFVPSGLPVPSSRTTMTHKETGLFLSNLMHFGEQWGVQLSARQATIDIKSFGADGAVSERYKKDAVTPSAAILFKPSPVLSSYASYTEGLEQGGTAPSGPNVENAGEILDPLVSQQLELGLKAEINAGLALQAAIFQTDRGLEYSKPTTDGLVKYVQDGRQIHQGIELSAIGRITDNLRTLASLMSLDAEVKETEDPALEGKRPSNVPQISGSLYLDWTVPTLPALSLNTGAYHMGKRYVNESNEARVASFTRYDLGAAYKIPMNDQQLLVRALIENIGNARYWQSVSWGSLTPGAPLTSTLSLEWKL